ncbi:hemerythrin domain-containing protein [Alicyclobacillus mengziensis]|uniref:Hemerythrin domain-containing protein n=1 Tax=Alicyclobacillus mengziensis TaxID=2931921 RepID=A0A9X7VXK6_9BACL|nr:hemerythrin domain-containing protein [Alicyclobacillus mengziensis]QSO46645.1 hemerythrin domain-containing protein [Alicyclobacillus mengziensis]
MRLSAPLQRLVDEHVSLRADMNLFYDNIEDMAGDSGPTVIQLFVKLHQQILAFTDKLCAHSEREEQGLFPMVALHLGETDKTIETMELEHKKAETHLHDFLLEADKADATIDEVDAQSITTYAVQAYTTLTEHFAKEERVLFPLAENILSLGEKKELERLLKTL